jgi:hypothetical protein
MLGQHVACAHDVKASMKKPFLVFERQLLR